MKTDPAAGLHIRDNTSKQSLTAESQQGLASGTHPQTSRGEDTGLALQHQGQDQHGWTVARHSQSLRPGQQAASRVRYLRVRYHVLDFWRDLEGFKLFNLPWVNILLQLPGALLIGQ